uniref:Uncharacterized protein n=1 Tax=Strongyloides venezuelensis TaxID=75913 RepID=A0A0K0G593_STRVS
MKYSTYENCNAGALGGAEEQYLKERKVKNCQLFLKKDELLTRKKERREQNRQINNIQDTRKNFKKPWKRNNNQPDRKNFYPRHNNNNFRKNNNKKGYTSYKNDYKPQFRRRNDTTTVNQLSVPDTNNTRTEISLRIEQHYCKTCNGT